MLSWKGLARKLKQKVIPQSVNIFLEGSPFSHCITLPPWKDSFLRAVYIRLTCEVEVFWGVRILPFSLFYELMHGLMTCRNLPDRVVLVTPNSSLRGVTSVMITRGEEELSTSSLRPRCWCLLPYRHESKNVRLGPCSIILFFKAYETDDRSKNLLYPH